MSIVSYICPYTADCPMYEQLRLTGGLEVWQTFYCRADFRTCARWHQRHEGRQVPDALLPNGQILSQLGRAAPVL